MTRPKQKVVQYLNEAHASEQRPDPRPAVADRDDPRGVLPLGARVAPARDARPRRPRRASGSRSSARAATRCRPSSALAETVVGQALALGKTPFDLLRGSGGEEKVLKNAKDASATEALEIATYTAIERLAQRRRRRRDREAGRLDPRRRGEDARARSCARSRSSPTRSSAPTSTATRPTTSPTGAPTPPRRRRAQDARKTHAKRTARQARKVPGVAQAEGQVKGAVASEGDLRDRPLRPAHGRRDHEPAARALADRPGQGRRLRAPQPEPHHGPEPHHLAARRRAVGRATTS